MWRNAISCIRCLNHSIIFFKTLSTLCQFLLLLYELMFKPSKQKILSDSTIVICSCRKSSLILYNSWNAAIWMLSHCWLNNYYLWKFFDSVCLYRHRNHNKQLKCYSIEYSLDYFANLYIGFIETVLRTVEIVLNI